ncbi:MAG TPA: thiamine pyrophosphate-binding protein [archaeon]|nr:thiamine pyrophosphate-binding protein [archaeon]
MLVSEIILDYLVSKDVKKVFLLTGGAVSFLVDKFHGREDIGHVCTAHEQSAAMAADAYSRMRPESIGVAIATSGPGGTNLLTGIGCSWFDSIPVLMITGQVNTYEAKGKLHVRQIGFQELDIVDVVRPITKFAAQVNDPQDILYFLQKAVHIAKSGRPGPVLLDIPMDIQRREVDLSTLRQFIPEDDTSTYHINCRDRMDACLELLCSSKRPILLAGGGVRNAGATGALKAVSERLGIPVGTSTNGIDSFPHDHPNFAGFIGVYGNRAANFALASCDLLIAVGSRLDSRQTGVKCELFARKARKIVVDIDAEELNVRIKADVALHSDARVFLDHLGQATEKLEFPDHSEWLEKIRQWKFQYPACPPEARNLTDRINPYVFLEALSKELGPDDVVTLDSGQNMLWGMQTISSRARMRMFTAGGMSPMGYSLPAAIGAAFAHKQGRIVCLIGDGGLQINIQELETLCRYNLPVSVFVMNNKSLGLIRQFQDDYLNARYVASVPQEDYPRPDFARIAAGYGIKSMKITVPDEIPRALKEVLNTQGPALCDVNLYPRSDVYCKAVMGHPIEDQQPYLEREELFSNILIDFDKAVYQL